jgi:prephenate dehydrogenase
LKVAVIGAAGAMGSFFVKYFLGNGHEVVGSDAHRVAGFPSGFTFVGSNRDAALGADVVIVAVPMRMTANVVREISPSLKRGVKLVEMTSVKGRMHAELRRIVALRKAILLSIHPLFGPLSKSKNFKICVIGNRRDEASARLLFPRAKTILLGAEEHDRLMAYTLSLVHLLNLAFVSAVDSGVGVKEFKRIATPLASAQLDLGQAVLSQNPLLFAHIQAENPFLPDVLSNVISQLEGFRGWLEQKDTTKFEKRFSGLAARIRRRDLDDALQRVYLASNSSA